MNCESFISILNNETYRPLRFKSYTGDFQYVKVNHRKKRIIIEEPNGEDYWKWSSVHYISTDTEDEDEKFDVSNMKILYENESKYLIVDEILNAIINNNVPRDYKVYIKGRHLENSGHYICYPYIYPVQYLVQFKNVIYWVLYYSVDKDDNRYNLDQDYRNITFKCINGKLLTNNA